MRKRGIPCAPLHDEGGGVLTHVTLPGGGKLGVYQARHARARGMGSRKPRKPTVRAKKRS